MPQAAAPAFVEHEEAEFFGPRRVDASITISQGGANQFWLEAWNGRFHGSSAGNDGIVYCPADSALPNYVLPLGSVTNPGTAPGSLAKIASGGELSRFILALKVALAEEGGATTIIFDEIDRGVGGAVASAIGERLGRADAAPERGTGAGLPGGFRE